jgi:hypothetical protein
MSSKNSGCPARMTISGWPAGVPRMRPAMADELPSCPFRRTSPGRPRRQQRRERPPIARRSDRAASYPLGWPRGLRYEASSAWSLNRLPVTSSFINHRHAVNITVALDRLIYRVPVTAGNGEMFAGVGVLASRTPTPGCDGSRGAPCTRGFRCRHTAALHW